MAKYKDTLLTTAGKELATRAANGQAKFTITRAVGSKTDLSTKTDDELMALTDLADVVQTAVMEEQVADPEGRDGVTGTQLIFANKDDDSQLNESYSLNAVGLYAKEDGTDTEILYAITTADVAEYMPDFASGVAYQFVLTVYVIVGQKANVTVNINLTGSATKKYVDDAIAAIPKPDMSQYYDKKNVDSLLVSKVTDNKDGSMQLNGAKVTPVDKAVNDAALATKVIDNKNGSIKVNNVDITPVNKATNDAALAAKVIDNKDGSITVNGVKMVPANATDLTNLTTTVNSKANTTDVVGINPNTSQITNTTVKANAGQILISGQPAISLVESADDATALTDSSNDAVLHFTVEGD